jgi:hypothetical protein
MQHSTYIDWDAPSIPPVPTDMYWGLEHPAYPQPHNHHADFYEPQRPPPTYYNRRDDHRSSREHFYKRRDGPYERHERSEHVERRRSPSRRNEGYKKYTPTEHRAMTTNNIKDPLSQLLPGPLAPTAMQMEITKVYENHANRFFEKELYRLNGRVVVLCESVRKFLRFEVENGEILADRNYVGWENEKKDVIEGLSRLWQMGNGLIYVCRYGERDTLDVYIYRVSKNDYQQFSSNESQMMFLKDPLFKVQRDRYSIRFV